MSWNSYHAEKEDYIKHNRFDENQALCMVYQRVFNVICIASCVTCNAAVTLMIHELYSSEQPLQPVALL